MQYHKRPSGVRIPDIILMRRYPEPEGKTTGIGVYSDAIEYALQADRVEYKDLFFRMTTEEGYLRCITEGFIDFYSTLRIKSVSSVMLPTSFVAFTFHSSEAGRL